MSKLSKIIVFGILIVLLSFGFGCTDNSDEISLEFIRENSKSINEYYYEGIIKFKGQSNPASTTRTWVLNNQLKSETIAFCGSNNNIFGLIFDEYNEKIVRYFIPNENTEANKSFGTVGDFEGIRAQTFLSFIDYLDPKTSKIIGLNKMYQKECILIETKYKGVNTKIWIDKELLVPIKVLNEEFSIEYKNIRIGKETISEDELKIPSNAIVVD